MPSHLIAAQPVDTGHVDKSLTGPSSVLQGWGKPYSETFPYSRWTNSPHHHQPYSNSVTHCRAWWRTSARFRLWSWSTTRPNCSLMATCSTPISPWRRTQVGPALTWQLSLCPPWPGCTPGCSQPCPCCGSPCHHQPQRRSRLRRGVVSTGQLWPLPWACRCQPCRPCSPSHSSSSVSVSQFAGIRTKSKENSLFPHYPILGWIKYGTLSGEASAACISIEH